VGLLDVLHRAVRASQRCCNSLATFSSKVVVVKTVVRQADEGLGGQYMDSGPVQDQASKVKRPRSSTRAGKRSSLYVLHLAARASQCCCNSFATFSLKAVVLETVVRQAEEGLGVNIWTRVGSMVSRGKCSRPKHQGMPSTLGCTDLIVWILHFGSISTSAIIFPTSGPM